MHGRNLFLLHLIFLAHASLLHAFSLSSLPDTSNTLWNRRSSFPKLDTSPHPPLTRRTWFTGQDDEAEDAGDTSTPDQPKYFREPDVDGPSHHYDIRFYDHILSPSDRANTLLHLVRSYLEFFRKEGMETWLAHGTLLGWWWNARMLPWDGDIDMQTSIATLRHMARYHNSTTYTYTSAHSTEFDASTAKNIPISRSYLLDVNPALDQRSRSNGDNIIDARWIDVRNGLYIDVTAVAETHPRDAPGVWACKNYHRYRTRDLWPMRESVYEGVVAKVPYAYERILGEEYGEKSLVVDEYQGYKWSGIDHIWYKKTSTELAMEGEDDAARRRKKMEAMAERVKYEAEMGRYHAEERPEDSEPPDGSSLY